jgi:hypothetical protein
MLIPLFRCCTAGINPMRHRQFQRQASSAMIGGAELGEEIPMPTSNPQPSHRPSDRCITMPPLGDLRPDLAAFFVLASREPAPRRISNELGVLAELRAQGGYN